MSSNKHQITALIYDKKNRLLSIGRNSYVKTHPLQARLARAEGEPSKVFLHAEVAAIVRLRTEAIPHRIAVLRFGRDGTPRTARPCRICQRAIREAGIKVVEHT